MSGRQEIEQILREIHIKWNTNDFIIIGCIKYWFENSNTFLTIKKLNLNDAPIAFDKELMPKTVVNYLWIEEVKEEILYTIKGIENNIIVIEVLYEENF